ncbi:hypothetical protein OSB04_001797 [Centaurea solstitialis]|uniref:3-deoxy-manno-octulosonate cytidylyltransferase n=1 Tax=Centaurea solstitialis TaxID=347529 RepID=A0AA38U4A2_9ASTR|nr:hypothetical protein OSB04_001797 [Centaurea solstitialis]
MEPEPNAASGGATTSTYLWPPAKGFAVYGAAVTAAMAVGYAGLHLRRSAKLRRQVVGIIPARYASSRFQGKPLVPILGKPMIQRTWERAKLATTLNQLVVATDDERIAECCRGFGADVIMTSESCRNGEVLIFAYLFNDRLFFTENQNREFMYDRFVGTERCYEALLSLKKKFDIVVNIQGDEPLIEPEIIDGVVKVLQLELELGSFRALCTKLELRSSLALAGSGLGSARLSDEPKLGLSSTRLPATPDAVFSTAVTSLKAEDACDPNRVKCVVDNRGYAIYFSRGLIPFNKSAKANSQFPYLLHLGIQSYEAKFLKLYTKLSPTPLQLEEDLEQLKVLENGYRMKVIKVDHDAHGVDTPEDVEKIESLMRERNLS